MRQIYTSCELGSYSIKILVCEIVGSNVLVLASSNTRCKGINNGEIVDMDIVLEYLKSGLNKVEEMLNIKVNDIILGINIEKKKFAVVNDEIIIDDNNHINDNTDIDNLLNNLCNNHKKSNETVLNIMPINYILDDKEVVKDPVGMVAKKIGIKAVITCVDSNILKPFIELFKLVNIKVVDITISEIGDYYIARSKDFDRGVSAIINIGYDKINISLYNKGIMIKCKTVYEGSKLIDIDLSKTFNIKRSQARKLKENFSLSSTKYSEILDTIELNTKNDSKVIINQQEATELVEARIKYLLKLSKKEINLLTKREISNIIVTGGITELSGFSTVCESVFDCRVNVMDLSVIGIRNNMYSSSFGLIKYFHNKLNLRNISYTMIEYINSTDDLVSSEKKKDGILNKMFSYFKDE